MQFTCLTLLYTAMPCVADVSTVVSSVRLSGMSGMSVSTGLDFMITGKTGNLLLLVTCQTQLFVR